MIRFLKAYFFLFNYIYFNSNKFIRLIILHRANGDHVHVPKVARHPGQPKVSWFCHLCKKDKIMDMRLCNQCLRYVQEEGQGLNKKEKFENFILHFLHGFRLKKYNILKKVYCNFFLVIKYLLLIEHCNTLLEVKIVYRVFFSHFKSDFNIWATFGTLCAKGGPQGTILKLYYKNN